MGGIQRDHFLRQRLGAGENGGKGVGNRHQRHGKLLKAKIVIRHCERANPQPKVDCIDRSLSNAA